MNHAAGHTRIEPSILSTAEGGGTDVPLRHRRPPVALVAPPLLTSKQSAPLPSASKAVNKK